MAISKSLLWLLVVFLLGFSSLANAIPATRTKNLMDANLAGFKASMNSYLDDVRSNKKGKIIVERKMGDALELEDYPGSGANYRHTPRPQFRDCVDC